MVVLALDTTTRQGSVALARDGHVIATFAGDAAITHGARLPGDLVRVLETQGLGLRDVDLFAVASGPGSFTGLRIGIATMQGLAMANGKPLAGVSALDAIYHSAHAQLAASTTAAAWIDAQRGQVFSAVYRDGNVIESALVDKPGDVLARWSRSGPQPNLFVGDGAATYEDVIRIAYPAARILAPLPPLAPSVALLAEDAVRQRGPSAPDAIRPIYIRPSDAEIVRDRKTARRPGSTSSAP
jgi:tRNA threonylcarbamoyladenosine biosynthesis protein TsaB